MIAGRQPRERRGDALRAGLRAIGIAQHDEVASAPRLGLAMHAQKLIIAPVTIAGGKREFAFGAAHLPLRAIVGVIALDQQATARSPLADVDAGRAGARTAAPRSRAIGRAARYVNTDAWRISNRITDRRSVVRSTFGDDNERPALERRRIEVELAVAGRARDRREQRHPRAPTAGDHQRVPATIASASERANPVG